VPQKELESCKIFTWETEIAQGGEPESTISPHYVEPRIRQVIDSGKNVRQRLRTLRYIEHLIQFHRIMIHAPQKTMYRSRIYDQLEADDKSISDHLMETFTDAKNQVQSDRFLSKPKLTKLYCWLLILCLKVEEDAKMDLWDIFQDLQIERKEIELAAKEIGATVKPLGESLIKLMGLSKLEAREHRLVNFRLPLQFPKNKITPSRRK